MISVQEENASDIGRNSGRSGGFGAISHGEKPKLVVNNGSGGAAPTQWGAKYDFVEIARFKVSNTAIVRTC